ncbi:hypothetical protein [Streptomyces sp. NPDC058614]|uniref:hypothetical protein n=1 Tax=Streptomyces sp. NPDC058614 TaxID=3346557 RepID=UPI003662A9FB
MIKRRTVAVAVATTLLGGLGAYGATAAIASPSDTTSRPTPSATSSTNGDSTGTDAMIQHCLKRLPANERAAAEKEMREMMSDHGGTSDHSMMNGHSGESMSGMTGSASGRSMTGMMGDAEGGS